MQLAKWIQKTNKNSLIDQVDTKKLGAFRSLSESAH